MFKTDDWLKVIDDRDYRIKKACLKLDDKVQVDAVGCRHLGKGRIEKFLTLKYYGSHILPIEAFTLIPSPVCRFMSGDVVKFIKDPDTSSLNTNAALNKMKVGEQYEVERTYPIGYGFTLQLKNRMLYVEQEGFELVERGLYKSLLSLMGCQHKYKEYVGFTETYKYCVHCDDKQWK